MWPCRAPIARAYYGMECKSSIFHSRQNLPYNSVPYLKSSIPYHYKNLPFHLTYFSIPSVKLTPYIDTSDNNEMGLIHAKEVHHTRTTQEETRLMNGKELNGWILNTNTELICSHISVLQHNCLQSVLRQGIAQFI